MPSGKTFIHVTNDERDLNKNFSAQYPILGDAKLVLRQFIEAAKDLLGGKRRDGAVASEIAQVREEWLKEWMPKLASDEVRQPARSTDAVLPRHRTPRLFGLGQVACAGDGAWAHHGGETRGTQQVLR